MLVVSLKTWNWYNILLSNFYMLYLIKKIIEPFISTVKVYAAGAALHVQDGIFREERRVGRRVFR